MWDGRRILSSEWIAEATSPQARTGRPEEYHYGWWVSQPGDEPSYFQAEGNGGQRILVVPSHDLVVVTTGSLSPEGLFGSITHEMEPLPANPAGDERLETLLDELARGREADPLPALRAMARRISSRTYVFEPGGLIGSLRLDFDGGAEAVLTLDVAGELMPRVDRIGLDGVGRPSVEGRSIVAWGYWDGPRSFVIAVDEGPGFHAYDIRLRFTGRAVRFEAVGVRVEGWLSRPRSAS